MRKLTCSINAAIGTQKSISASSSIWAGLLLSSCVSTVARRSARTAVATAGAWSQACSRHHARLSALPIRMLLARAWERLEFPGAQKLAGVLSGGA